MPSSTSKANFGFTAKRRPDGSTWIMLERIGAGLEALGDGFLGLELTEGTSFEVAENFAHLLQHGVRAISFTSVMH